MRRAAFLLLALLFFGSQADGLAQKPADSGDTSTRDAPNNLRPLLDQARTAFEAGNYQEAARIAEQGLREGESLYGLDDPRTLLFADFVGGLYLTLSRYAEAEALYQRVLPVMERMLGRDHASTLGMVVGLAVIHQAQNRYAEAEPLFRRALEAHERTLGADHPNTLIMVSSLASVYRSQGRLAEAEPFALRAVESRERALGREHASTLGSINELALLYAQQQRYAEAEPLYLRALEATERTLGRDHSLTLTLVNNLSTLYNEQGRYAEAEPLQRRVLDGFERTLGRENLSTLTALNNLARTYNSLNRMADAEPLFLRALEAEDRTLGRDHPVTLTTTQNLAYLYWRQGRAAEAERFFMREAEGRERTLGPDHLSTISANVALAFFRLEYDRMAAVEPARRVVAALRSRWLAAEDDLFSAAQLEREQQWTQVFRLLAEAIWWSGARNAEERTALTAEAFTALQDAMAGRTDRAVRRMAIRRFADEAGSGLGALVREREALEDRWAANGRAQTEALAGQGPDAETLRQRLRTERRAIDARIAEIDASLRADFPQYFALIRPQALDVASAQALLAPDEAILLVVPSERATHVIAVTRDSIGWMRSDWTKTQVDEAVARLLGDLRRTLTPPRRQDEEPYFSYDRRTAHALYGQVVAPVGSLLQGKRHVFIAAAGSLSSLPFGILVTEEPQGEDSNPEALRTTRWFADAHALIQIPSIQSLQFLRRFARPADNPSGAANFIGLGNPRLEGPSDPLAQLNCARGGSRSVPTAAAIASTGRTRSGGMMADVAAIRQLCPLPGTSVELERMRAALDAPTSSLVVAEDFTEPRVRQADLTRARVIAFATHGVVAGGLRAPAEPGLVLTPPAAASEDNDGYLAASEVTTLRLDADWVILSACNTAAGDGSEGAPGLSGLARAFFYAGARNLLASHWPVVDEVGPRLTVRAVELSRGGGGLSYAEALQRAMREIREDRANEAWSHPAVWAPFSLVGDGAR